MIPQPTRTFINPDPSKRSDSEVVENFWAKDKLGKYFLDVENYEEQDILAMGNIDFTECRFKITNMSKRLCECTVHKVNGFAHGLRLHPPHLFDIRDGVLYKNKDGKFIQFIPEAAPRLVTETDR